MIFVDTNYFVRFFVKDISSQYKNVKRLFYDGAKKKKDLFTSTIVIFELYWLFGSFYKKSKGEVVQILEKALSLDFVQIEERKILENALEIFKEIGLEFEDCYNIAYARRGKMSDFATFDKKIKKYLKK